MSRPTGGPAFPRTGCDYGPETAPQERFVCSQDGMSLRDYFAAAALNSQLMLRALSETPRPEGFTLGQHIAQIAYTIADRMIMERNE